MIRHTVQGENTQTIYNPQSSIHNRQSTIQNPKSKILCRFLLLFALLSLLHVGSVVAAFAGGREAQAKLYVTRVPTPQEVEARNSHALHEPALGCYLGAFIDFDPSLKRPVIIDKSWPHQDPAGFEQIVQKSHAVYFFYMGYGRPLPLEWVRWLGAHGKYVHIALEPNSGLDKVQDDAYLRKLADDMKRSGAKIFLRYASEMNGEWVNYHFHPEEYRRKFKLVHDVMHQRAPNVALVWCPYMTPEVDIAKYWPGDDAVDWVGVNMYSVTYHNNTLNEPAEAEHPSDFVNYVYTHYTRHKPMMICEFAATHYAACEDKVRADFAARKISTLYAALPRLYPRVKCINYFDSNNMKYTKAANNNYSVTDDPTVLGIYRNAVRAPYFLDRLLPPNAPQPVFAVPMPMRQGEPLRGPVELSCFARAPGDEVTIRYKVDNYVIYTANNPDQWACHWNAGSVKPGPHKLTLEVFNAQGKLAASQTLSIVTKP